MLSNKECETIDIIDVLNKDTWGSYFDRGVNKLWKCLRNVDISEIKGFLCSDSYASECDTIVSYVNDDYDVIVSLYFPVPKDNILEWMKCR